MENVIETNPFLKRTFYLNKFIIASNILFIGNAYFCNTVTSILYYNLLSLIETNEYFKQLSLSNYSFLYFNTFQS